MRRLYGIPSAFSLSFCLLVTTPVWAQGVEDENYQQMLKNSELAATAFANGEFGKAAILFEAADKLAPDDVLKMNAMIAWFKHGDCSNALKASNTFLDASPKDTEDSQILKDQRNARSVQFKCSVTLGNKAFDEGEPEDADAYAAAAGSIYTSHTSDFDADDKASLDELTSKLEAAKKAERPDKPIEDPVDPPPAGGGLSGLGWAGVGGIVVGGALLAGAGVMTLDEGAQALLEKCSVEVRTDCLPNASDGDYEKAHAYSTQYTALLQNQSNQFSGYTLLFLRKQCSFPDKVPVF